MAFEITNGLFGSSYGSTPFNNGTSGTTNTGSSSGGFLSGLDFSGILGTLGGIFNSIRCWGSSWTPSKAENFVRTHTATTSQALSNAIGDANYSNLENVNTVLYAYKEKYIDEASWIRTSSPGRCSKESIQGMLPPLDAAFEQMVAFVGNRFETANNPVQTFTKPLTHRMLNWAVTQFKKKEVSIITNPIGAVSNGLKLLGGGILLPMALIGTLVYWFIFGKNENKTKKRKNQWFKK